MRFFNMGTEPVSFIISSTWLVTLNRYLVIHRISQQYSKYRLLRKTDFLPLPFFYQLNDVLFGRRVAGGEKNTNE